MSEVVFIFGAGASKDAGVPLMGEFLDVADELRKRLAESVDVVAFETVNRAKGALQRAHSKSELDIVNLESVFCALDMARILGIELVSGEDVNSPVLAMRKLIQDTIEHKLDYPVPKNSRTVSPPYPYDAFADKLRPLVSESTKRQRFSFITFNYDLALDYLVQYLGLPVNYWLDKNTDNERAVALLKLHGSLNWGVCEECNRIIPWSFQDKLGFKAPSHPSTKLILGKMWRDFPHEHRVEASPLMIPPTWNKTPGHTQLHNVWAQAARELSEAEYVAMVGYSLPDTDLFFKYLYALGSIGPMPLKRLLVVNPDSTVESRFRSILGPGAEPRFEFCGQPFLKSLTWLFERIP